MTLEEIKIRRLANQHLLEKTDCMTVLHDLCGVQAQFLSNAMHALKLRCSGFAELDTSKLIKSWTVRGTIHVFSEDDLPLFLHKGRKHYLRPCDTLEEDEYITKQRKQFFSQLIMDSVASGVDEREALREICRQNGMSEREELSVFNSWGGTIRALCESGAICHKLQEKKAFRLCPEFEPMEQDAAQLEMARRYFTNFGPATIRDAAYFFGFTQKQVKALLELLPVEKAECDGKTYFYIDSGKEYPRKLPECIFLAGFDQLLLGYRKEDNPFMPTEHLRGIFTLAGIVNPSVLLHGRIIGKWKKKNCQLTVTAYEVLSENDIQVIKDIASLLWPDISKIIIKTE